MAGLNTKLFAAIAPALSNTDSAVLNCLCIEAELQLDEKCFGKRYDMAIALLVAHMVEISKRAGLGGQLTSCSVGSVSKSYAVTAGEGFSSTSYGQELNRLKMQVVTSPFIVC